MSPAVEAQSPNQSVFPSPQGNTKRPILDSENELPVSGSTTRLKLRKEDGFWQASLVAQVVKNLPAMQETQVRPLGREGPLEKGMATHSSILAWEIIWTEEPVGYSPQGHKESETTE